MQVIEPVSTTHNQGALKAGKMEELWKVGKGQQVLFLLVLGY